MGRLLIIAAVIFTLQGAGCAPKTARTGKKPLEAKLVQELKRKYHHCLKAFGSPHFCECLKEKLPVGISFREYVGIITATKEELNKQGTWLKRPLINKAYSAREFCVAKVMSK